MLKGVASAEQLRDAEICATLYFHSSYIDNSPNSICEAQMLGLPIVSTNVGGIPSLVDHGVDGFLFPSNDPYQAAYFIEKLFLNPDLNNQMGEKGKQKAVCRHDRNRVREQILNVYKSVTK
jgi:glycosyltransferase involved in cell wall biosynthesis